MERPLNKHEVDERLKDIAKGLKDDPRGMENVAFARMRLNARAWRTSTGECWQSIPRFAKIAMLGALGVTFCGGYVMRGSIEDGRDALEEKRLTLAAVRVALNDEEILAATGTCADELQAHIAKLKAQRVRVADAIRISEYEQARELAARHQVPCEPAEVAGRRTIPIDDRLITVNEQIILNATSPRQ